MGSYAIGSRLASLQRRACCLDVDEAPSTEVTKLNSGTRTGDRIIFHSYSYHSSIVVVF
jgi:hypothetical protein